MDMSKLSGAVNFFSLISNSSKESERLMSSHDLKNTSEHVYVMCKEMAPKHGALGDVLSPGYWTENPND